MPERNLRFGVIGAGGFAEICHVPGLQTHPGAEVIALCGRRKEHARAMADRLGVPDVYTDYRELVARDDLDAVTITTPNGVHCEQAVAAFEAGKHVFCEKPLGVNVAEARRMTEAAEQSGLIHQVAFTFRYIYGVQELRRRIRAGEIGTPFYTRIQFDGWGGLRPDWKIGWRESEALAGGGQLYDMGSHHFDTAYFLLGEIEAVSGRLRRLSREREDARTGERRAVETDDLAAAWFRTAAGAEGEWFQSRITPSHTENGYVEVIGEEGALQAALSRGNVERLRRSTPNSPAWEDLPLPPGAGDGQPHGLGIMMRAFVESIRRGSLDPEVDAPFRDGLRAQQGLAAVERSAAEARWVRLEEVEE
jgi:predicted dehydrogenase